MDWEFPFFEKHIADLGKEFPEQLGDIYNFVRRARMLGRMQQAIIEEMRVILANETPMRSEEKNKTEKAGKSYKTNKCENMVNMKDYLNNVENQNIQLVLEQIKELKNVIEMLPDEMEIENKKQCMKK